MLSARLRNRFCISLRHNDAFPRLQTGDRAPILGTLIRKQKHALPAASYAGFYTGGGHIPESRWGRPAFRG